jgi:hypothetical protein
VGFAETAQKFEDEALATLVEVMRDKGASPNARARCASEIIDRARGKAVPAAEQPHRDFVPLAERIKWYARRDAIEAAEGKIYD